MHSAEHELAAGIRPGDQLNIHDRRYEVVQRAIVSELPEPNNWELVLRLRPARKSVALDDMTPILPCKWCRAGAHDKCSGSDMQVLTSCPCADQDHTLTGKGTPPGVGQEDRNVQP